LYFFLAVDFICTDPAIRAISFVGSDHVVCVEIIFQIKHFTSP